MRRLTFEQFVTKMIEMPEVVDAAMHPALTECAVQVQKTAVKKFGEYQPEVGPFPAWALLSIETVNRKMDYGGASGPNPLIGSYGSGQNKSIYPVPLRQSIQIHVDGLTAQVGTNDPVGLWHEYGNAEFDVHYPPRPFLRPALYENEEWIKAKLKAEIGLALMGVFR